jgi:hypothetical protein
MEQHTFVAFSMTSSNKDIVFPALVSNSLVQMLLQIRTMTGSPALHFVSQEADAREEQEDETSVEAAEREELNDEFGWTPDFDYVGRWAAAIPADKWLYFKHSLGYLNEGRVVIYEFATPTVNLLKISDKFIVL